MKRRITLSIALVLSIVLVSLMNSDSTAKAERTRTYIADTGMINLGPNEFLRITVAPVAGAGREELTYTFDVIYFAQRICDGLGACTFDSTRRTTTEPLTLGPDQGASHDITGTPGSSAVRFRGFFIIDRTNVRVNAFIINTLTGSVVGYGGGVQVAVADVNLG